MSLAISKLGTSNDMQGHFSQHQSFKVCIANVSCPGLKVVEVSKEDKELKASKGDYSRVNAVNRDVCDYPSATCHKPCFVPSVMFDIVNEVHTNLLEALWNVYYTPLPWSWKKL
jgi:hypothetical protein